MIDEHLAAYLAWSHCPGIGTVGFQKIIKAFGTAQRGWCADIGQLGEVLGMTLATRVDQFRRSWDPNFIVSRLKTEGVCVITDQDDLFPEKLKNIDGAPFILYVKVAPQVDLLELFKMPAVAIVGTRKITSYGRQVTEQIVRDLTAAGVVIVSGLMYGVDEVAHRTAMQNNGQTIGVWAGGIDSLVGTSRAGLARNLFDNGSVVISEFPVGVMPTPGMFPVRNRIVSGLSSAVVVIEASLESGSLITAGHAAAQGREVFAVPGPVTSYQSLGTAKLIQKGAYLITGAQEILETIGLGQGNGRNNESTQQVAIGDKDENEIVEILKLENKHIDELVRSTGWGIQKLTSVLSLMEVRGQIRNLGGMIYGLA